MCAPPGLGPARSGAALRRSKQGSQPGTGRAPGCLVCAPGQAWVANHWSRAAVCAGRRRLGALSSPRCTAPTAVLR
eukprot:14836812-Alexandrium_andersonii.AAC.1